MEPKGNTNLESSFTITDKDTSTTFISQVNSNHKLLLHLKFLCQFSLQSVSWLRFLGKNDQLAL